MADIMQTRTIVKRIRLKRLTARITQDALAAKAGISPGYLSQVERAIRCLPWRPSLPWLKPWASRLQSWPGREERRSKVERIIDLAGRLR